LEQTQGCRQQLVPSSCLTSRGFLHPMAALCAAVNLCAVVSLMRALPVVDHDAAEGHQSVEALVALPMHCCCELGQVPLANYVIAAAAAAAAGLRASGVLQSGTAQVAGGGLGRAAHLPVEHRRGEAVRVCGGQAPWGVAPGGHRLAASEGCASEDPPVVSTGCSVVGSPRWMALPQHPAPVQAVDLLVEASEAVALPALAVRPSALLGCSQSVQEVEALVAEAAVMVGAPQELPLTPLRGSCASRHPQPHASCAANRDPPMGLLAP